MEASFVRRIMTGRRAMMLAGASAALCRQIRPAGAVLPVPAGQSLSFRLMRHGGEIGRHTARFERQGDQLTVHTAVDALVTLISIPIVRYTHRVLETWQGDTLTSVTSETDKNGAHEWMKAHRTGEGLEVLGSKTQRYIAPEPARCTSYWDKQVLDGPMISLEDGVLLRPIVAPRGKETIPLAAGGTIAANHYNLSGAFNVDLWYDQTGTWASLAFDAADGSNVHYERL
jgi:hypothetical protein